MIFALHYTVTRTDIGICALLIIGGAWLGYDFIKRSKPKGPAV